MKYGHFENIRNYTTALILSIFIPIVSCEKKESPTDSENRAPTASFSISPEMGTTEVDFNFDASSCSDTEDPANSLLVRWDWENDGFWDTEYSSNKRTTYKYNSVGTKNISLEVKDSGGLTAQITRSLIVDSKPVNFVNSGQSLGNTRSFGVAIADVDLDNDNDIFITNYIGPSRLWINNGNGVFTQDGQNFYATRAHGVDIADLNGDNFPDIFIANHNAPNKVFINDGSGHYTDSGQSIGTQNETSQTVQLTDVDRDGDIDALIYNSDSANRIWLNNGDGFFTMTTVDYGGSNCMGMQLADFNGDSAPDLYTAMRNQPNQIWINNGSGNFSNNGQLLGNGAEAFDCKDIDEDGDIDVVEANYGEIKTWLNQNNTGSFTEGITIEEGALDCVLFDADLDGDFDLITAHIENGNKLWINDGSGIFVSMGTVFGTTRVLSIAYADFDADADYDVLLGKLESTGGNQIYFND